MQTESYLPWGKNNNILRTEVTRMMITMKAYKNTVIKLTEYRFQEFFLVLVS